MSKVWQVQEAKASFITVVDEAVAHGPQVITRHGKETAVLISYEDFLKLKARKTSLSRFFRRSPLAGADLDLTRDKGEARADVEFE